MFSVISNVSMFLSLFLFIRMAGRYTNSSLLSERFPWRAKQLRAGLSGDVTELVKGSVLFTYFFLFRFVESAPRITKTPPDPFFVLEGDNITLVWHYNLSGAFDDVVLKFINSTTSITIVDKFNKDRDAKVSSSKYRGRIEENINATQAEITIFQLQRSESADYEIELINDNRDRTTNRVTVQVQCK